ncbi:MAG: tetratricopeptide repeat protein [Christensenellales bacterium]
MRNDKGKNGVFSASNELMLDKADALIEKGQYVKAVSLIRRALENQPASFETKLFLAEVYHDMELYALSNNVLFELMRKEPKNPDVLLLLGKNYLELNELSLCGYYFKLYSENNAEAEITLEPERIQAVRGGLELVHPMTKRRADLLQQKAGMLIRNDRLDDAKSIFEELERNFPDEIAYKNNTAFTDLLLNDYVGGEKKARDALSLKPDDPVALCNLVTALYMAGKREELKKYAEILAKCETEEPVEIFKIATTFCEIKFDEEAFVWLEKLLKGSPYELDMLFLYGFAAFNCGKYEKFEEALTDITTIDESNAVAWFYRKFMDGFYENSGRSRYKRLIISPNPAYGGSAIRRRSNSCPTVRYGTTRICSEWWSGFEIYERRRASRKVVSNLPHSPKPCTAYQSLLIWTKFAVSQIPIIKALMEMGVYAGFILSRTAISLGLTYPKICPSS